ncbi:MAG: 50S ribosomal protein L20 [Candidatus Aerophobetes bacterium]
MTRVKRGVIHSKKRKKVLRQTKGYRGGRGTLYTLASEALKKALFSSYRDRRRKKRDFRRLWITRIRAAAVKEGLSYSRFIQGIKKADVNINRKILSDLAVKEPGEFSKLVKLAKKELKEQACPRG